MSTPADFLLDNPIIVKHKRSRLRTAQVVPGVIVVLCICGVFTFVASRLGEAAHAGTFGTLSVIAALVLVIGGGNQVAMSVGSAKESGILDFHRVSPLPAETVTLGFFLGAPIREYMFFAVMLPFILIAAWLGNLDFVNVLNVAGTIFLTAWLIHSVGLFAALVAKKPRMASAALVGVTIMILWIGSIAFGMLQQAAMANGQPMNFATLDFFGVPLPRLMFLALYEGAATAFFLVAATRKMRADRAITFAKWEGLLCMATVVALTLGAFWKAKGVPFVVPALLHVFVIAGIVLGSTITPGLGDYVKGVRRSRRLGHRRAAVLTDHASNLWTILGLAAWVAVGAVIAWESIEVVAVNANVGFANAFNGRLAYTQTIAVGVLTVCYYGFGKQFFALKYAKRGEIYFRLFLFFVWVMPMLVAVAAGVATMSSRVIQMIMGVSPWAGMILSIEGGPAVDADAAYWVRFMALAPCVAFTCAFFVLTLLQQRKIDGALTNSPLRVADKEPIGF